MCLFSTKTFKQRELRVRIKGRIIEIVAPQLKLKGDSSSLLQGC